MVVERSKSSERTLENMFSLLLQQRFLAELEKVTIHKGIDVEFETWDSIDHGPQVWTCCQTGLQLLWILEIALVAVYGVLDNEVSPLATWQVVMQSAQYLPFQPWGLSCPEFIPCAVYA